MNANVNDADAEADADRRVLSSLLSFLFAGECLFSFFNA